MWYNVIKIKQTTQTERFKFLEEEKKNESFKKGNTEKCNGRY